MPFVRRDPLLRMAAVGGVAYMGARAAGRRSQAQAQQQEPAQQQAAAPQPEPAAPSEPSMDEKLKDVKQLADLHASGALTDEEFERQKTLLLG